MSEKFCIGCGQTKAVEEFTVHILRKDGRQSYCKQCRREQSRLRYALRREELKAQTQQGKAA
jgi:predicted Fe-S protein YdhL (DUF1289 family)